MGRIYQDNPSCRSIHLQCEVIT